MHFQLMQPVNFQIPIYGFCALCPLSAEGLKSVIRCWYGIPNYRTCFGAFKTPTLCF